MNGEQDRATIEKTFMDLDERRNIGGCCVAQLVNPGNPVMYGSSTTIIDPPETIEKIDAIIAKAIADREC